MTDVEISWDPRISRRHCRLWEKDGRVWFQDLASRNGSWIGSERVSGVVRLAPGASILIGETILLFPDDRKEAEEGLEVEETHERPATPDELALLEEALEGPASDADAGPASTSEIAPEPPTAPLRTEHAEGARAAPAREATLPPRARAAGLRFEAPVEAPVQNNDSTVDLRVGVPPSSDAPPEPRGQVVRSSPRFVSSSQVKVRARDREDLRKLWMRDISKGGLFVETKRPPSPGTPVEVELETPAGTLTLRGTVVHVLEEQMARTFGGEPGVGVQFTDLDQATRSAIQSYVDGLAERLPDDVDNLSREMSAEESDELVQLARRFLHDAEKADFYTALGLKPTATADRIEAAASGLHQRFTRGVERLPPPRGARIEAALNVLGRVRRILAHDDGRLEYDFRNGHVRAKERIQAAQSGAGPSLSSLRQAWNRVFPDRVDRAALLTRKAFAARQRQDLAAAIDAGRAALELNPFFEELKQTVEVWEMQGERRS
jgi:uncharacterized protein (TIGR02266 family)